jgi:hypothetical protein
MKHWTPDQIALLSRLRAGFLDGSAGREDYWGNEQVLTLYDRTFGERIAWKWAAALGELMARGWRPEISRIVDAGCGSGVASWSLVTRGKALLRGGESVVAWDRSALARAYTARRLREAGVRAEAVREASNSEGMEWGESLVLVSHVATELSDSDWGRWTRAFRQARALIWVDAGTHEVSRRLVEQVREPLCAEGWRVIAPCTHAGACPLRSPGMERHWCHHFAQAPSLVHQDAAWRELSEALGIDLRALPYSFLAMENPALAESAPVLSGVARVLGQPREFKGYLKILSCEETGSGDWMLQKRDAPSVFRDLVRRRGSPWYRWTREGARIRRAEGVGGRGAFEDNLGEDPSGDGTCHEG